MTSNEFRTALRNGQPLYGMLIASDSPDWPDQVVQMGLDFVFIDTEHIAIDRKALAWMCHAYSALHLPPIVRIPQPDPQLACMALDGGAAGVMAPYVETVDQVKALCGAVKMRPLKGQRLDDVLHRGAVLEPALASYLEERNRGHSLIINVESRPALDNLEALLAVDGLDGVLVGPHDLSVNLGVPEQYDAPEFDTAVRTILRKSRARGIGAGIFSMLGTNRIVDWSTDGLHFVVHGADHTAMREAISSDVRRMREATAKSSRLNGRSA